MAVVLFETILVVWYIIARKYENAKYGMIAFGLTKLYPIINNILLILTSF